MKLNLVHFSIVILKDMFQNKVGELELKGIDKFLQYLYFYKSVARRITDFQSVVELGEKWVEVI